MRSCLLSNFHLNTLIRTLKKEISNFENDSLCASMNKIKPNEDYNLLKFEENIISMRDINDNRNIQSFKGKCIQT